jgi:hypothetical protein
VMMSLTHETPLLFAMNMSIVVADDEVGFITSDMPCIWHNSKLHTFPPFYRHPGLAQKDIEVCLPLTPQHMLLISHKNLDMYVYASSKVVQEVNRTMRLVVMRSSSHGRERSTHSGLVSAKCQKMLGKKQSQEKRRWPKRKRISSKTFIDCPQFRSVTAQITPDSGFPRREDGCPDHRAFWDTESHFQLLAKPHICQRKANMGHGIC